MPRHHTALNTWAPLQLRRTYCKFIGDMPCRQKIIFAVFEIMELATTILAIYDKLSSPLSMLSIAAAYVSSNVLQWEQWRLDEKLWEKTADLSRFALCTNVPKHINYSPEIR